MAEERNIEKQLRAAAAERQARGGSFPLHPATRRLLQGEAHRVHGAKTVEFGGRNPIFAGFRLRFVSVVLTMTILAGATWFMFFCMAPPKTTQMVKLTPVRSNQVEGYAKNLPTDAAKAKVGAANAPMLLAAATPKNNPARDEAAERSFSDDRATLSPAAPVAPKPVAPPAPVIAPSPAAPQLAAGTTYDGAASAPAKTATENLPAILPAEAPAHSVALAAAPGAAYTRKLDGVDKLKAVASEKTVMQREQEPAVQNLRYLNAAATTPVGPRAAGADALVAAPEAAAVTAPAGGLLNSFQVEQHGEELRIVDGDGSVYTGKLLAAARQDVAKDGVEAKATSRLEQRALAPGGARGGGLPAPVLAGAFNASGTNVSLQQKVTINASFVNGSIVGNAELGNGVQVRLNAAPAAY